MTEMACPPCAEAGGRGERGGRQAQQGGEAGGVPDAVGDEVGGGDGHQERGEFDDVAAPVEPPPRGGGGGGRGGSQFSHANTMPNGCCVITNAL